MNIHGTHEIKIILDGVTGFKTVFNNAEQSLMALLGGVGMLYGML